MLGTNNNDYDYNERERQVIELYDHGKSTRDIAKELRMSLRDISSILRKNSSKSVSEEFSASVSNPCTSKM